MIIDLLFIIIELCVYEIRNFKLIESFKKSIDFLNDIILEICFVYFGYWVFM